MFCSKCGHENEDDATFCRKCGVQIGRSDAPVSMPPPSRPVVPVRPVIRPADDPPSTPRPSQKEEVSLPLAVGIIFVPFIFAWFTLREGYSSRARVVSLGWCALALIITVGRGGDESATSHTGTNAATPRASTAAPSRPRPAAPVVQRVPVTTLLSEYKDNEIRADGKFKGKRIEVSGRVEDVKKDFLDNTYVTLGTGKMLEIPVVQCFLKNGQTQRAATLSKGDSVTVQGEVDGLMMNVLVRGCIIK